VGTESSTRTLGVIGDSAVLVVRAAQQLCAVPLQHVSEVMRPLPVQPVSGAPAYVRGVAVIRGAACPVVDLGFLLGGTGSAVTGRFVALSLAGRAVCLAVDEVERVAAIEGAGALPPLLGHLKPEVRAALSTVDGELLTVLEAFGCVEDELWESLLTSGALS
jgi:purine-binding chemotaxis protein CheW